MKTLSTSKTSNLSLPSGSYIYSLRPASDCLAAISSDDSLRAFDLETLKLRPGGVLKQVHEGVTCIKSIDAEGKTLATGGRDGAIRCWDLRSGKKVAEFEAGNTDAPILSLDCTPHRGTIAAGTELAHSQAALIMWDIRSSNKPQLLYVESHNDDITELQFHPTDRSLLLSGSTDGLVNIYNTNIIEEEDALHQIINHGSSIHFAGFLNELDIFALSHDESLSMYQLANPDKDVEEPSPTIFGDVRTKLSCEYTGGVLRTTEGAVIGAGSHKYTHQDYPSMLALALNYFSKQQLDLIPLRRAPEWHFDETSNIRLQGAHGDDIIRSIYADERHNVIYTGGEDGHVRAWKPPEDIQNLDTCGTVKTSGKSRDRTLKDGRFKPY